MNRLLWTCSFLLLAACGGAEHVDAEPAGPCGPEGADTDGDGVCDADDVCPGFDDVTDTDGDGVPDGCDACPVDAGDDSDGDGVCDSDDPCPLDAPDDTDGDGVCDTDDVCPDGDDTVDRDGDGVPDDCDPCPLDERDDRDGDGLCDTDDPCPDDVADDTDGDGVCDSWDVCPGLDDDLDADLDGSPDGCECAELDVPAPVGVPSVPIGLLGMGLGFEGIVNDDQFHDFGFGVPRSATLRMWLYDGLQFACSIWWDLTRPGIAVPNQVLPADLPVVPFAAWDITLTDAQTDCDGLAPEALVLGAEGLQWTLSIGPMHQLDQILRQDPAVDAAWDTDWEPYVMSAYLTDEFGTTEVSYVRGYDRTCEALKQDPHTGERVLLPKVEAGPLLEFYEATPMLAQ